MSKSVHSKGNGAGGAQDKGGHGGQPRGVRTKSKTAKQSSRLIDFEDNRLLVDLVGENDRHLAQIERALDVALTTRGNRILAEGGARACEQAVKVLEALYARLEKGDAVGQGEVEAALRLVGIADAHVFADEAHQIRTQKRVIGPRTPGQARYIRALKESELVFALGPAGTGKTYLAVAYAVSLMIKGEVERIILSRPAVEAGERLGFLPGDMREKVDPYLRPLYDALHDTMPGDKVMRKLDNGDIEVAPLAFMRGRTLSNVFAILDEAQNTTPMQMKMFLTRLGENSRMVVTGDPSQIDLPPAQRSGLIEAEGILSGVEGVSMIRFTDADVIRHPLVMRIVRAYNAQESRSRRKDEAPDGEDAAPPVSGTALRGDGSS